VGRTPDGAYKPIEPTFETAPLRGQEGMSGVKVLRVDPLEIIGVLRHQWTARRQSGDEARRRRALRQQRRRNRRIGQQTVSKDDQLVLGSHQRRQVQKSAQGLKIASCRFDFALQPQHLAIDRFGQAQDTLATDAAQPDDLPRQHCAARKSKLAARGSAAGSFEGRDQGGAHRLPFARGFCVRIRRFRGGGSSVARVPVPANQRQARRISGAAGG
jgi:hypothetical protein